MTRNLVRKLLIAIAILVAIGIVLLLFFPTVSDYLNLWSVEIANVREIATPPADLLDAKARWTASPVSHYRLTVHYLLLTYPHIDCLQDVEVVNEAVAKVFSDTCSSNGYLQNFALLGRTVTELFAEFQQESTTIRYKEQGNPGCGYFLGVNVAYALAGNPTSAQYSWYEVSPWTLGAHTYQALYPELSRIDSCMSDVDARPPNLTISLQPLS